MGGCKRAIYGLFRLIYATKEPIGAGCRGVGLGFEFAIFDYYD